MSFMQDIIDEHLNSSSHLTKKHVHPRLSKMLEMGGMNVAFVRATGNYLWDGDGNRYLDLLSGGGVYFIGRHHPVLREALDDVNKADLPNLCVVNSSVLGGLLAGELLEMAGSGFTKVQYSNSGAESNEVAIRFARFCTRRRRFLHMKGSFHGRTYGAISLCGFKEMNEGMDPMMPVCTPITPNDYDELRYELSKGDVAGVFYEACQGMTLTVLEHEYLREMRRLCTEHGAMMIADEVQTGLGRMGKNWFAYQNAGVVPDMVSLSKTLSGGAVPIAATLIGDHVYDTVFKDFKSGPIYFSTFAENNLAMAAGLATLRVLRDIDARTRATQLAERFRSGLLDLAEKYDVIDRVVGEGLMIGLTFKSSAKTSLKLQQKAMMLADGSAFGAAVNVEMFTKHRVIVQIPGPGVNAIKILPPVNLPDEDVDTFLQALDSVLGDMYKASGGPALSLGKAALKDAVKGVRGKLRGGDEAKATAKK